MTFSDTEMRELGRSTQVNIHNTRSLIRTPPEEPFTEKEYEHTHTHTHTHTLTRKQEMSRQMSWYVSNKDLLKVSMEC